MDVPNTQRKKERELKAVLPLIYKMLLSRIGPNSDLVLLIVLNAFLTYKGHIISFNCRFIAQNRFDGIITISLPNDSVSRKKRPF